MQFSIVVVLAALGVATASALPRDVCTGVYKCPAETTNDIPLAHEFDNPGSLSCFYGETLPGPGIGPVDPSCDYNSTTGALTASNIFQNGQCPTVAECWLGTLPPKRV